MGNILSRIFTPRAQEPEGARFDEDFSADREEEVEQAQAEPEQEEFITALEDDLLGGYMPPTPIGLGFEWRDVIELSDEEQEPALPTITIEDTVSEEEIQPVGPTEEDMLLMDDITLSSLELERTISSLGGSWSTDSIDITAAEPIRMMD